MLLNLVNAIAAQAFVRIRAHELLHEGVSIRRNHAIFFTNLRVLNVSGKDVVKHFCRCVCVKRQVPSKKLEDDDTERPKVKSERVFLTLEYLRCNIRCRARYALPKLLIFILLFSFFFVQFVLLVCVPLFKFVACWR